ncbi:uncharacterized protein LOC123260335 [Cotesia glomerata]|uniref:G-protein coupled receptors family 2 profile 2 domain-containing protein n=1 Tax=Cotesia glomerata TaxID=32391 RepID=A0AAV7ICN4_COTGL|nr:uncharacterized protein LOC123260335 [Cotesia glomerata]KAH0550060.1 hypothetical protein KQX54_017203 [Cotesia glomerata]
MHPRPVSSLIPPIQIIFLLLFTTPGSTTRPVYLFEIPRKCCSSTSYFNEHLECIARINGTWTPKVFLKKFSWTYSSSPSPLSSPNIVSSKCHFNISESLFLNDNSKASNYSQMKLEMGNNFCVEETMNGTTVLAKCLFREIHEQIYTLGAVIFWGAQTYMSTNIAHVILCTIVVIIYLSVPRLQRGVYNRCVVRHNICLMMAGVVLQILGFCELGNCQFNDYLMILSWLVLQYFTIATALWLNVVCYDMTLAITKFRWMTGAGQFDNVDEKRKIFVYGLFSWGGSLVPVILAGLCDYIPAVPKNFILKPNYLNFRDGPSPIVNLYFFLVPAFTLLLNNVLFVYTTFKIIKIQRSTEIATANQTNLLKKKYFLFLRLYLLMGAPWFFGMVLACLNKLVLLKTCRLIQPSLWLLILATHKSVILKVKSLSANYKRRKSSVTTISA